MSARCSGTEKRTFTLSVEVLPPQSTGGAAPKSGTTNGTFGKR